MEKDCYGLNALRRQEVVKANTLIQQSRHNLSLQQQKILLFLISQIKPEQDIFIEQTFTIVDFCKVCDIETAGGSLYNALKAAIKTLADKSLWLPTSTGGETLARWLAKARIEPKNGTITVKFDDEMKDFLLQLRANFTKFQLIYTLTMRSKYAVRLYELLKSYENMVQPINFNIDRLKKLIGAEYTAWKELDRRAIKVAVMEINTLTDISVQYNGVRVGRSFESVNFTITRKKDFNSQTDAERAIFNRLTGKRDRHPAPQVEGQLSLDDSEIQGGEVNA